MCQLRRIIEKDINQLERHLEIEEITNNSGKMFKALYLQEKEKTTFGKH